MKLMTTFLIVAALAGFATSASAQSEIAMILKTKDLPGLNEATRISAKTGQDERACEIQRRQKIAPSLCYRSASRHSQAAEKIRELDQECRTLSQTAVILPSTNEFTSEVCRLALERRAQDLVYVENSSIEQRRDALR